MVHAAAPKHVSFLAFCAANVVIDIEPLHYMLTGQFPLHRFFHTYVGATLILLVTVALFLAAFKLASVFPLPNLFKWKELTIRQVAIGAALGSYSHIVLDSLMHSDIRPFARSARQTRSFGLCRWALCIGRGRKRGSDSIK